MYIPYTFLLALKIFDKAEKGEDAAQRGAEVEQDAERPALQEGQAPKVVA